MKITAKLLCGLLLTVPVFCARAQSDKPVPSVNTFVKPGAKQYKGMFNIYVQDDKYLMEIPNRLLGRDILTTVSIIEGSAQRKRDPAMRFGYAGDAVGDQVISFRKSRFAKMELVVPEFVKATDTTNIYIKSLRLSLSPSLLAFDIVAASDTSSMIDITKLFAGDNELFSLKGAKDELKLGAYEAEKSKITGVSCFANNIVFRSIKSYAEGAPLAEPPREANRPPSAKKPQTYPTQWLVGSSWCLLPEQPMTPRYADRRVGYFLTGINNYDKDPQKVEMVAMANRWRMEPKPADVEKYLKGELVEPQKPIVFYIDRNTPAYLIPYFIKGVNAWQSAFEKIGFKNAIIGKLAPTQAEDPGFSMEDSRYSYISYKPSEMANAYGPQVVDPRSGEILSSHVAVFHNIMELLERWYFSMCAATDPRARQFPFDHDLMGSLLKNVITHEVGHTLGLRHDFAGSASYPVDSIRNKKFVQKNGFGPSVMDYMRFNYAAQPQDQMSAEELLPHIGVYDDFAIDWGYRYRPQFTDPFREKQFLQDWVSQKRKDPRFFYYDESDFNDPRVQAEDVGDDDMKANRLGVNNLKITMANLEKWTAGDDDRHTLLRSMYRAVEGRYYTYLKHALKSVGGGFSNYNLRGENSYGYKPVSYAQQKEAMAYLKDFMFTEPKWLYAAGIKDKTHFNFSTDVEESYSDLFGRLVSKYPQMVKNQTLVGDTTYCVHEFLTDLQQATFGKIMDGKPISEYDRMLQRTFMNKILMHVDNKNNLAGNVSIEMINLLNLTASQAKAAAAINHDLISKSHLIAIVHMIDVWRTGKKDSFLTNLPVDKTTR
ncbi:zinc-dependent metalloprotease [Mucilaginibacter paludis]|uniref:Peptidase M10A and M12B matrixin and adamalysin n=1 Tax=Mucilaginibacter paludis DSM 18603 TaxID=714943 RepID=H1Y338_9SPHI|nr:zinc-dependent metalloprotease [Mucilaginibacter paludis]EHQ28856.1 hypothetical protein Mucpa_4771 [Mucilaginibacter paludis DSM 18603]